MKKTITCLILLVLSLTCLLSGCIEIDVDIKIDEHFTSVLSYSISLDAGVVDAQYRDALRIALNNIGWYYQENLDFVIDLQIDSDPYVMVMTRRIENNSLEQAYKSLEDMLTNEEMTMFMEIDMAFQSHVRQSRYILGATADIPKIIQLSNSEELTPALQQQLEEAIETGKGSITVTLPASEVVDSSHPVQLMNNQVVMTVPMSYTGQTGLELKGVVNRLEDGTPGGIMDDILRENNGFREISLIVCGAALLVIIILIPVLIVTCVKRKRRRESWES